MASDVPGPQGFLNSGDLNTQESGKGAQAFSPTSSLAQPTLDVVAPLNVDAAPGQAMALAKALNVGISVATPYLEDKARTQGEQLASQGSVDALHNAVDPDKLAKIEAYRIGATRTSTEQQFIAARDKVWAFANSPEGQALPLLDSTGDGTTPTKQGLMSTVDSMMHADLGHMAEDPHAAPIIAPMMQHLYNEIAGARTQRDVQNNQANAVQTASALAGQAANTNDPSAFVWKDQLDKLTGSFMGDRSKATEQLVKIVGESAAAAGRPDLIDQWVPKSTVLADGQTIDGPALTPENAAVLDSARIRAQKNLDDKNAAAYGETRANLFKGYDDQLNAGQPLRFDNLLGAYRAGTITQPEVNEYWRKSLATQETATKVDFATNVLLSGKPWTTYVGLDSGNGKPFSKDDFEQAFTNIVSKVPPEQQPIVAAKYTRENGLVYKPLQSTLNNTPLTTPQGVKQTLDTYSALGNYDMPTRALYFDSKRAAQLEAMKLMREQGMSDQQLADYVSKIDPEVARENYSKFTQGKVSALIENAKLDGSHWLAGDFRSVRLNDLANAGEAQARIAAIATQIGQTGLYSDPATIVKQAEAQYLNTNYLVKLPSGHALMLPRADGDLPPAQVTPALVDFYAKQVPTIAKASKYAGDATDLKLLPAPYQAGVLQLVDPTGTPVNADRYTVNGITSKYLTATRADIAAQTRKDQEKAAARAIVQRQIDEASARQLNVSPY